MPRAIFVRERRYAVVQPLPMKMLVLLLAILVFSFSALAQTPAPSNQSLIGEWQLTTTRLRINGASRLVISQSGNQVQGNIFSDGEHMPINGTLQGNNISFQLKVGKQEQTYVGTVDATGMSGTFTMSGKEGTLKGDWTAQRMPQNTNLAP
jgi:hypothetical protein